MNADNTITLNVTIDRLITTEQLIDVWFAAREHHEKAHVNEQFVNTRDCPECLLYRVTTEALTIAARTITIGKAEE